METRIKQRLVGALILIALAVVFWPIIFVPQSPDGTDLQVVVPAAPPVDLAPLPEPDNAGLRRGREALVQSQRVPDVAPPEEIGATATEEQEGREPGEAGDLPPRSEVLTTQTLEETREALAKPALDADGLPIAFSLQVATMGDKARAEKLRDELIDAGYKAYTKRLRRDERVMYRVLVGPKYSRDDLQAIKTAVDSAWRVESMIIRYLP